ncbi:MULTISPECIES: peptidyl-prolyl cis-trans isomerase [unclassified Sinorhizobium]|uniref:peptidylprolyl isomerase n=1 Tax=unclassified Sinorhizobium TaxID=2613772 RepID=UPI0024C2CBEE|nr:MULTISPECIES: peptidyl-prolyl cis-trans isomerase [unclassified Sinorhizobium]MDK1373490.1 peptidyl-prolyl cis-trans isomerase [Sinorhizobium sp. 6-70]MDK1479725.1 peptidyl-prolyl cis-trans isomerase [Sinorhizobium sp. 6-117]
MKLFPIAPEPAAKQDDVDDVVKTKWQNVLREPLLHFLVVGSLLFGGYHFLNPGEEEGVDTRKIVLTKDDVRQLAISWLAQGRSAPTPEQIMGLVDQKVTQEILFREAVALGLDRDDEVVKRRLAQKMDFLAADVAALQEPTTEQLNTWFTVNSERFALPAHASFRHLYFSPDKHGKAAREAAAAALATVGGRPPENVAAVGDTFMFQNHYRDATPEQMAKEFGPAFSEALFQLTPGKWEGPIRSGYGWHLVWIDAMDLGRIPAFTEVIPSVKAGWIEDQYREIKRIALDEMRSRYVVTVPEINASDLRDLQVSAGSSAQFEVPPQ